VICIRLARRVNHTGFVGSDRRCNHVHRAAKIYIGPLPVVDKCLVAITLLVMLPGSVITAMRLPTGIVIAWEIYIYVTLRIMADAENEQKITGITYRHRVQPSLILLRLHCHRTIPSRSDRHPLHAAVCPSVHYLPACPVGLANFSLPLFLGAFKFG
jgi:hypothetical protein